MRQIVLDTETTGLSVEDGHRIIEIGCLEVVNRRITGNNLHFYVNPERAIDEGALAVHGIGEDMLRDKPRFHEIADELLRFVEGSQVLIHNAPFDEGFLDAELQRVGAGRFRERYGVSNAHRKLHGALLDAELLADVYLAMTRGQDSLEIALHVSAERGTAGGDDSPWPPEGLVVLAADDRELYAHEALLKGIEKDAKAPALWTTLGN